MKIAIPVDDKSMESKVCISFGRTPYFLIYDTETKASEFLENSAASSQGGAGIKAAQSIVDNKVDALITPRCGENAADVLKAGQVKIYKTVNDVILDNIDGLNKGKLSSLSEIHAGFHNHGGK
jgi:predicted Fe-Mo cluster-binding NifX family protein